MAIDRDRLQTESCHILLPRGCIEAKEHVRIFLFSSSLRILFSFLFHLRHSHLQAQHNGLHHSRYPRVGSTNWYLTHQYLHLTNTNSQLTNSISTYSPLLPPQPTPRKHPHPNPLLPPPLAPQNHQTRRLATSRPLAPRRVHRRPHVPHVHHDHVLPARLIQPDLRAALYRDGARA